jgi:hypothetical protein
LLPPPHWQHAAPAPVLPGLAHSSKPPHLGFQVGPYVPAAHHRSARYSAHVLLEELLRVGLGAGVELEVRVRVKALG